MIAATSPEVDVEQLMGRIREEVARRKRQLGHLTNGAPSSTDDPVAKLPPKLSELLQHQGEAFVDNAYRTLLGREPDADGLQHCLAGLSTGTITRTDLLRDMCRSEEGRNIGAEIKGLTLPYALGELLGGDDTRFVTGAYRDLLGREPDEDGARTYREGLADCSLSRIDVLRILRFSDEGRQLGVEVTGLLPPVAGSAVVPNTCPVESLPAFEAKPEESRIAVKPQYELGELLGYQDELFVGNAYRAILRREPDPEGLRTYLGGLRQGSLSKLDVLGGLRFSSEGRKAGIAIHGLLLPFLLHAAYRVPLLGFLMALASILLRPGKMIGRLRGLEANLDYEARQRHILADRLAEGFQEYSTQTANRFNQFDLELSQIKLLASADHFAQLEIDLRQLKLLADAKANQIELTGLRREIDELKQGKADRNGLETLRVSLRNTLENKVDASEVSLLQLHLKQAVETKAEQQALADLQGQLADTQAALAGKAEQQALADLQGQLADTQTALAGKAEQQALADLQGQLRVLDEGKSDKSELTRLTSHLVDLVQAKAHVDDIVAVREQIQHLASVEAVNGLTHQIASLEQAKVDSDHLGQELVEIQRQILDHKRNIVDQQRRLSLLLEEARKRLPEPLDTMQLAVFSEEVDHVLDAMYVSFEDHFRGTREDIKQRLSAYLPCLPQGVGSGFAPAVDLGCGRGEWLELLKEQGLTATGVDLNRVMVKFCHERELEVVEADALAYLRDQPDGSLGLITGFHIIEHLPLRTLIALLDESLRVLKLGGMVIFETPNPENLVVGACNFYMDPTHRNPLPPVMTQFLVEARGFVRCDIWRMNQAVLNDPLRLLEPGTLGAKELNPLIQMSKDHYFAAPDYAVLGYKA